MADTIIKRIGGKVKIRKWIIKHLPAHTVYCEPFGGSFAVGYGMPKPDDKYRMIYKDLDGHVWNLFRVIRDHRDEFLSAVVTTPYSRRDFDLANEYIEGDKDFLKENPVEWARNYLIYNRQCMFGKEDGSWCVSRTGENICLTWARLPPLIEQCAAFLRHVYIENLDYEDCMRKWDCPEALFYLDPPYKNVEKNFYHVNKKKGFDHKEMADVVKSVKGSCAISYYDSEAIRQLYPEKEGFAYYKKSVAKSMQTEEEKDREIELLIVKKSSYAERYGVESMCFGE